MAEKVILYMKYYMLILFLFSGCSPIMDYHDTNVCKLDPTVTKFYYYEKIKVIGGFYKGCIGVVDKQSQNHSYYEVNLTCFGKIWTVAKDMREEDMETIK